MSHLLSLPSLDLVGSDSTSPVQQALSTFCKDSCHSSSIEGALAWVGEHSAQACAEFSEVWYAEVTLPESAAAVFQDPARYAILCWFCQGLQNLEYADGSQGPPGRPEDGEDPVRDDRDPVRVFCNACCWRLGAQAPPCACGRLRYVDPLGAVARVCSDCHQRGKAASAARPRAPPTRQNGGATHKLNSARAGEKPASQRRPAKAV